MMTTAEVKAHCDKYAANAEAAKVFSRESPFSADELTVVLNQTKLQFRNLEERVEFLRQVADIACALNISLYTAFDRLEAIVRRGGVEGNKK